MNQQGFTLLEILVALLVFSIMSILTYGGMQHVLDNRDEISIRTKELNNLQLAFSLMKNDLEQTVNRPVRDRLGSYQNAFESKVNSDVKLAFTTQVLTHWQLENSVSSLQRVEYRVEGEKLLRYFWPVLDRAHNTEPESMIVLEGVKEIKFEFINQFVHEFWPLPTGHRDYEVLPRAVRVKFKPVNDYELERLFILGTI